MSDVMIKFENSYENYLTKEQIRETTPLVFAEEPTNPDVSNKYLFVNTETIIDDLAKLNWFPVTSAQRKAKKKEGTIYSKHMVAFQNPDIKITSKNGDDAYPRILLTNSHDGRQSFQFSVGIFRLVCSNGLVVADEKFSDFRIKHKGYTFDELRTVVAQTVQELPNKVEVLNKMKDRVLTQEEKFDLAMNSMLVRAGVKEAEYDVETLEDILEPTRDADKGDDLWTVFNVIQEKMINGGFHAALTGAKVRKVKKIKSFERDMQINKDLFKLATQLI